MTISEKAKEYAEGKALNALTSAIESAYSEGYNAGYNDALASKPDEKPEDLDDGVKYVDLGLPSGTKWAADYLKDKDGDIVYLPYDEAAKLRIPTVEQVKELLDYCVTKNLIGSSRIVGTTIIGLNGNYMDYSFTSIMKGGVYEFSHNLQFWIINNDTQDKETSRDRVVLDGKFRIEKLFMGYRLPVILVR